MLRLVGLRGQKRARESMPQYETHKRMLSWKISEARCSRGPGLSDGREKQVLDMTMVTPVCCRAGLACFLFLLAFPAQVAAQVAGEEKACVPDPRSNLTLTPRWWCEHNALHTLNLGCDAQVVETIVMPWWSGEATRSVNVLPGQEVESSSVRAFRLEWDGQMKEGKANVRVKDPPKIDGESSSGSKQNIIKFRDSAKFGNSTTWKLMYLLKNGVVNFTACPGDGAAPPTDISDMATIWRPEGVNVEQIQTQNASFQALAKFLNASLEEARALGEGYSYSYEAGQSESESQIVVSLRRRISGQYSALSFVRSLETRSPAALSYMATHGIEGRTEACPVSRICDAETYFSKLDALAVAKDEAADSLTHFGTIGLSVVVGMLMVGMFAVFVFTKKRKKRKMEEVYAVAEGDSPNPDLPGVLREEDADEDLFSLEAGSPRATNSEFWAKAGAGPSSGHGKSVGPASEVVSPKLLLRNDFESSTLGASSKHNASKHNTPKSAMAKNLSGKAAPSQSGRRRKERAEETAVSPKDLLRKDFESTTLEVDMPTRRASSRTDL